MREPVIEVGHGLGSAETRLGNLIVGPIGRSDRHMRYSSEHELTDSEPGTPPHRTTGHRPAEHDGTHNKHHERRHVPGVDHSHEPTADTEPECQHPSRYRFTLAGPFDERDTTSQTKPEEWHGHEVRVQVSKQHGEARELGHFKATRG